MVTALFVDAGTREIKSVEYGPELMRRCLPGGPTIACVFDTGDVLYVDDEGLLHPATVAFRLKRRSDGQPMMSNGLLLGGDDVHGGTLPCELTAERLIDEIEWLTVEEALAWFRARANEPAVTLNDQPVAMWQSLLDNLEGRSGYRPY